MSIFKQALSFFIPVNIHKQKSAISKNLEVTWNNGQLVLDSLNTNYSYGSLQRILRKGLHVIGFDAVRENNHILVLGVAAGSVIKTLTDEVGYKNKITGVEIDEQVVEIANSYFHLNRIENLEIIVDDAFEFVLKTKIQYDLIIIDIFCDVTMPNFLFENFFTNRLSEILIDNGKILFNTMILNAEDDLRNKKYLSGICTSLFDVRTIPRVENHNELILLTKKSALV